MNHLRRPLVAWALYWLLAVFVSLALAKWQELDNLAVRQQAFDRLVSQTQQDVVARVQRYVEGLTGVRALMMGGEAAGVSRRLFREYSLTRDREKTYPGARGFGYIQRVTPSQMPSFVAAARADDFPAFAVRQIQPHPGDQYVIQFFEPLDLNRAAIGLDVASENKRWLAAELSMASGQPVMTGPITLVQSTGKYLQSVLIMLPVYRVGADLSTEPLRRAATLGWSYTALELDQVLSDVETPDGPLMLSLTDRSDPDEGADGRPLLPSRFADEEKIPDLDVRRNVDLLGRHWDLHISARQAFVDALDQRSPRSLFLGLVGVSTLMSVLGLVLRLGREERRGLRLQQARMAAIMANSIDGVIGKTLEGVVTDWNDAAERIFGYSATEAIGQSIMALIVPPDRANEESEILRRMAAGQTLAPFDTVRKRKDGALIDVMVSLSPIRGRDGTVVGVSKIASDITERKQAQAQILRLNETLAQEVRQRGALLEMSVARERIMIDQALSAVIVCDAAGQVKIFNQAAEKLLGYRAREVVGREVMTTFHDAVEIRQRVKALTARLGRPLAPGEIFRPDARSVTGDNNEWLYVRKDGTRVPVLLTVGELHNDRGELDGFIGIAADLTERKRLEQELSESNQLATRTVQAEAANAAKSLFLANMSHEIRTPLNAMIGLGYLLERTKLNELQRDFVQKIKLAGQGLLAIINDVLDLSKIEAGEMELDPQPFRLSALLSDVVDLMETAARQKELLLLLSVPNDLPEPLVGDAPHIQQVLVNLLSNAIKFTDHGRVVLEVKVLGRSARDCDLRVAVRDTGVGIDESSQSRLFAPFTQADPSTTRRHGGTGLGLFIVKQLVELMNGSVGLSSVPGQGSEFWFNLRLALADSDAAVESPLDTSARLDPETHPGQVALRRLKNLNILLVDDSNINQQVGQQLLENDGAHVTLASNGMEALDRLRSHPQRFDVVLMDLQMPVMDGHTAASHIRGELHLKDLPVIALTAGALQSEREHAMRSGMNDFMVKPIDPDQVVQMILRHVKRGVPSQDADLAAGAVLTESTADWPEIAGIASDSVRRRLSGDAALFRRLLRSFVTEYPVAALTAEFDSVHGSVTADGGTRATEQRQRLKRQLHQLRGSASMLGMSTIAELAHAAEMILVHQHEGLQGALQTLASELQGMAQAVADGLGQDDGSHAVDDPAGHASGSSASLQGALELAQLLRERDFAAMKLYASSKPGLQLLLGDQAGAALDRAMTVLDFKTAAQILTDQLRAS